MVRVASAPRMRATENLEGGFTADAVVRRQGWGSPQGEPAVLLHFGRVLVSIQESGSDAHAEDGGWPRKNYPPKTSNANDNEVGNTGEQFGQAMSLAEADAILAKFGYNEEDVVELAA